MVEVVTVQNERSACDEASSGGDGVRRSPLAFLLDVSDAKSRVLATKVSLDLFSPIADDEKHLVDESMELTQLVL